MGTGGVLSSMAGAASKAAPELASRIGEVASGFMDNFVTGGLESLKGLTPTIKTATRDINLGETLHGFLTKQRAEDSLLSGQYVADFSHHFQGTTLQDRLNVAQGTHTAPWWQNAQQYADTITQQLNIRGAKQSTPLGPAPLVTTPNFMPIVLKGGVDNPHSELGKQFIEYLAQTTGNTTARAEKMAKDIASSLRGRNAAVSMHDVGGQLPIPMQFREADPLVAYAEYGKAASRYITQNDAFGPKNQLLHTVIDAMIGPNTTDGSMAAYDHARNVTDAYLYGQLRMGKQFYSGQESVEQTLKGFEGLTKLGRAVIPHSVQSLNTVLLTSVKSTLQGLSDTVTDWQGAKEFALRSGSLINESIKDWKADANGERPWMDLLFHYSGFDAVRKFNIVLGANASKYYANDLADSLLNNAADKEATTMLKVLGMEPTTVLRQGGLTPKDYLTIARRANEITNFIGQNPADLPIYWNKNATNRMMTLYKGFIWNDAKFLKDTFQQSIAAGKYQNFAYYTILFPVIGELIGDAEGLARGQMPSEREKNNPILKIPGMENHENAARYMDNLARLGHIGMFLSIVGALNRNNLAQWIGGPAVGDLVDVGTTAYSVGKEKSAKPLAEFTGNRVPVVGPAIKNYIKNK